MFTETLLRETDETRQGGANSVTLAPWHTKSRPRMLVASKAVFLENYLVVSTWILNGSSIDSLAGVRFGSLVIKFLG